MSVPGSSLGLASLERAEPLWIGGLGCCSCHHSAWWPCSLSVRGDTHTRGQATSGTTLSASSLAIATQQGVGGLPKERAGPFHQSPRDHAAVPSSGELHWLRGVYTSVYGVRGHCDNELVTVPQETMVTSQIPPRSMSGLTPC